MSGRDFSIEVASDPRHLYLVRTLVRGYLEEAGFLAERISEVVLGVDEACTNAIRHACASNPEDSFRLSISRIEHSIEIQLEDSGDPVPPEVVERGGNLPVPEDMDSVEPGGLGVHLMHQVFDEVEFCAGHTQGNCITMKLRLPD